MEQPLRVPLSVGELVSDALAELRKHLRVFAVVALPFSAVDLLCREAASSSLDAARNALGTDPSAVQLGEIGTAALTATVGIGLYVGSFMATQLLGAVCVFLAARAWARAPLSLGDGLRGGLRRALPLVVTGLLLTLMLIAAETPAVIGAVVLIALQDASLAWIAGPFVLAYALAALVLITLRFGLFTQTCVLEGHHTLGAFSRSAELVSARGERLFEGPKVRLSLVFLVSMALGFTLQGLFSLPRFLMAGAIGWSVSDAGLPPLTALPLWFGVPFSLVEVATNAVLYPFTSILLTLFYFDLRVRTEAIDLAPAASAGTRAPA